MRVRDGVRRVGVTIEPDQTVSTAARIMEESGVGSLVVVDEGGVAGIVTDRDLVRRVMAPGLDPDARIDHVMSTPVVTVQAEDDLTSAFGRFRDHALRRLVVLDGSALVGVLTIDDLLIDLTSQLGDLMRPVTAETIFGQHDSPVPATR